MEVSETLGKSPNLFHAGMPDIGLDVGEFQMPQEQSDVPAVGLQQCPML